MIPEAWNNPRFSSTNGRLFSVSGSFRWLWLTSPGRKWPTFNMTSVGFTFPLYPPASAVISACFTQQSEGSSPKYLIEQDVDFSGTLSVKPGLYWLTMFLFSFLPPGWKWIKNTVCMLKAASVSSWAVLKVRSRGICCMHAHQYER